MSAKHPHANNLRHNETRQLRSHNVSGAFLPDKGAWLRYWRLYRWWRRGSEKNNGPTPMERLCKGRRPGRAARFSECSGHNTICNDISGPKLATVGLDNGKSTMQLRSKR